jgi:hypothetical protein
MLVLQQKGVDRRLLSMGLGGELFGGVDFMQILCLIITEGLNNILIAR